MLEKKFVYVVSQTSETHAVESGCPVTGVYKSLTSAVNAALDYLQGINQPVLLDTPRCDENTLAYKYRFLNKNHETVEAHCLVEKRVLYA